MSDIGNAAAQLGRTPAHPKPQPSKSFSLQDGQSKIGRDASKLGSTSRPDSPIGKDAANLGRNASSVTPAQTNSSK